MTLSGIKNKKEHQASSICVLTSHVTSVLVYGLSMSVPTVYLKADLLWLPSALTEVYITMDIPLWSLLMKVETGDLQIHGQSAKMVDYISKIFWSNTQIPIYWKLCH